ncbi:MAG TPA: hybrid sensor histidine kinase/response regulator, partial [Polyangiaceae bacterium]|nr:hybrid sensor histidine kinase/response regulator [Polyangiaceae bacterium]
MELSALERMTRLLEVTAALLTTMTPDQVAGVVMHMGLSALGARAGALLTVDDESGEYVLLERACDGEDAPARTTRLALDAAAPVAVCARTGRAVCLGPQGICLPLLIRGHAIGALAVELPADESLDEGRRALLAAAADQCAQALERARLYALEQLRREELERSNRMKDDFLGIVSHELRTPLSAILGWARMLKQGMVGSSQARERALEAIERNATLQARLVDDLLDVSRIVSGKLDLETSAVDLSSVIDAAVDSVRPTLLAKGVETRLLLAPEGVTVLGDARRLQQVIWNLLTNAIKFTRSGGRIELGLERVGCAARISVKDNGIGIPQDALPHVFERFKQADGSATRQYGGLGLGLSIVHHVVEAHGGAVRALSEGEGKGAEIIVELPVLEIPDAQPFPAPSTDGAGTRLEGARVLLVDDDIDTREFLATALRAAGGELRAVGNVDAAFDAMRTWRPDVIVSDIAMPEQDGYAFIRGVRALTNDAGGRTPAVALTALARAKDRVCALAAG